MLKPKLNENKDLVKEIKLKIKNNEGFCPCAIQKTPETKCPCKEFRDMNHEGECHCGLYRKVSQ